MEDRNDKPKRPGRNDQPNRKYLWLVVSAMLFGLMTYFMFAYPGRSVGPRQPIPFSHRIHAGVKEINCRFCHSFVERSQNAGIPSIQKCFFCHKYIIPQHPEILKELEHFQTKKPVRWIRIFFTPDYVFFHHRPHVAWNRIECTQCHGDVKTQDRLVPVNFQMGFCMGCHRKMKAQMDCWLACHR